MISPDFREASEKPPGRSGLKPHGQLPWQTQILFELVFILLVLCLEKRGNYVFYMWIWQV